MIFTVVSFPHFGQIARHRKQPDLFSGKTSNTFHPLIICPSFSSPFVSRLRHGWLLPSIRARQTAAAFAKTQGAVIHVFYHSALTLACVVVRLFSQRKYRPLSKMLSSQFFHNIFLRSIRSALPTKSGDTQGTHASRRTSPAQCEAGCPPALQKRSDCVRRP